MRDTITWGAPLGILADPFIERHRAGFTSENRAR
jgi:hypothetical protein